MTTFTLPWPPSLNRYYRTWQGRMLISKEGREYRIAVAESLMGDNVVATEGRLKVTIDVYPPDRRRRDLDNMLKALLDALQHGGAFPDDAAIDDLRIIRCEVDKANSRVVVTIEPIAKVLNDGNERVTNPERSV